MLGTFWVGATPREIGQATYDRELPRRMDRAGKFAVAGVYDTYDDALQIGYDRFGLNPFMVKQIELDEPVLLVTRTFFPCLT